MAVAPCGGTRSWHSRVVPADDSASVAYAACLQEALHRTFDLATRSETFFCPVCLFEAANRFLMRVWFWRNTDPAVQVLYCRSLRCLLSGVFSQAGML